MAAKSTQWGYDLLRLVFNAVTASGLAENDSVTPLTQFYVSLHTADPGVGGSQNSSETNYIGYARQAVNRTAAALPVSMGPPPVVNLAAQLNFPDPGVGTGAQVITFWAIGTLSAGAGEILYRGPVTPNIPVQFGQTGPALTTATYIEEI